MQAPQLLLHVWVVSVMDPLRQEVLARLRKSAFTDQLLHGSAKVLVACPVGQVHCLLSGERILPRHCLLRLGECP
jgi:hypothetical protein